MSKIAITALVVVCVGIGAIIGGLGVHYGKPYAFQAPPMVRTAHCLLVSEENVTGSIEFKQSRGKKIVITGDVEGLSVGKHGFHIHEYGVVGDDCKSSGAHFNPYKVAHGNPRNQTRHVGDMGNIETKFQNQTTSIDKREQGVSMFGRDAIIGRGLVIHQDEDTFGQPTGNAGGRVACCTIMYVSSKFVNKE